MSIKLPFAVCARAIAAGGLFYLCFGTSVFATEFRTLEWTDLIPEDDLQALLNPPSYIADIEDGSLEECGSAQRVEAGLITPICEGWRWTI